MRIREKRRWGGALFAETRRPATDPRKPPGGGSPFAFEHPPIRQVEPGSARLDASRRLAFLASPADTKSLIETAIAHFLDEVPALEQLKLVAGLELRARHDTQLYRVELPGPVVTKATAEDAKITLEVQRPAFNDLAATGKVSDWRAAFEHGDAKATGVDQYLRLIRQVVEKHEDRGRARPARRH